MLIGEFLQAKMNEKHISKAELSRLSGVPATTIGSMISRNNTRVAIETLLKICEVLGCDINEYIATIRTANSIPDDPEERVKALHDKFGEPNKKTPSMEFPSRESAFKHMDKLSDSDLLLVQKIIDSIIEVRQDCPE